MIKASEQNLPIVRQSPETEHWLYQHVNTAELCGIAHLSPGNAVIEIQGLRSHLYDLSKCIAICCKTQSFPASSPNFAYVRPVIDAGTFVAEFRLSERAAAMVRTNEASGEVTRWT
jgi:hypothetical protein